MKNKYIAWFKEIGKNDIGIVGGKGANLGEMTGAGIPVPYGFVVTANAYFDFIKETGLAVKIKEQLQMLNLGEKSNLQQIAKIIRELILKAKVPDSVASDIMVSYLNLTKEAGKHASFMKKLASLVSHPYVAVRSSATAEDLPGASFAGQQETYLNVSGEANLIKKVHEAWASLFTARAIFYREEQKFDHMKVGIAIVVQLMVNSEKSGIMFTLDPVTNDKNTVVVEGIFGLGELIVQGDVTPDHFEVDKKTLTIKNKKLSIQTKKMIKVKEGNKIEQISKTEGLKQKLTDEEVIKVAKLGLTLEKHYFFPQDSEWAIEDGNVYIVQTRPVTTVKTLGQDKKNQVSGDMINSKNMTLLLKGDPASPGIAWGPVKIIYSVSEIDKVLKGDVLVTRQTNPDFVPAMKKAVAIITERGGRTSHAAIVSRELGIPAIVGTVSATKVLQNGLVVTVNGLKGEIYKGGLTTKQQSDLSDYEKDKKQSKSYKTATKVYVNLATPERAAEVSKMGADGIGLLRAEFMIADIGTHPKKLIKDHKEELFITKLSEDLVKFCKSFNPRPVVYRATDFKTNEYRNLIGGKEFEPEEPNPMLGYRGAYRYMSDPQVFNLELEAIKRVRNKYGYKNLWLMLPFVRTVRELTEVKKIIATSGLSRSANFKLWMMVEIPSNVILLDQFCEAGIDGVSIGSNDLTMLILGTDRDNTEVSPEFDERNDAVLWAIERVIKTCHKYKITSSICGQAPSDYPDLVEKLVKWGVTSMSVNSDAIDHVRETIYHIEEKLIKSK
jgi:pyruvate, water dikinase